MVLGYVLDSYYDQSIKFQINFIASIEASHYRGNPSIVWPSDSILNSSLIRIGLAESSQLVSEHRLTNPKDISQKDEYSSRWLEEMIYIYIYIRDMIIDKNKCSSRWLEEMDDITAWVHD